MGTPLPPAAGRFTTGSAAGRPGTARHVRRSRVQARRADVAHASVAHRRREFLCAAAGLDNALPARHRGHRRLHRVGGQLRTRVAATAVGCVAVFDPCARPRRPVVTEAPTPTGPITRASVTRVGTATVVSALCGYTVLYLAARDLEPAGFSVFGVFWGAFGLVSGAAFGLLQEATRGGGGGLSAGAAQGVAAESAAGVGGARICGVPRGPPPGPDAGGDDGRCGGG